MKQKEMKMGKHRISLQRTLDGWGAEITSGPESRPCAVYLR
jgi:hypothetical protein